MFEIKEGVLYPLLHNLLENKYITCFEEVVNRRIRVYYHIEKKGEFYLSELFQEFNKKVAIIQNLSEERSKTHNE